MRGAGARALALFFGRDNYTFTAYSDTLKGVSRKFTSFSACAEECGISRIYGGIHYNFSNINGLAAGRKVADHVHGKFLSPQSR